MMEDRTQTVTRTSDPARDVPVTRTHSTVATTRLFGVYRDSVSWGAIWGGLLTAIGLFILLSVLATAIGITAVQEAEAEAGAVSRIGGVVSAVLGLLAFFVGGFVAGRGSGAVGHDAGALNGFLVWALALVLMLVLAGFGLGAVFGTLAEAFGPTLPGAEVDPNAAAQGAQSAAWIAFISLALAATAATLGGWIGAATDDDVVAA